MNITLSPDKGTCTVNGAELKVGANVDYESADTNEKASMGKILEFKYAGYMQSDKQSVWMNVKDLQEDDKTEWVSVYNWAVKNQPVKNESTKPEPTPDLPL